MLLIFFYSGSAWGVEEYQYTWNKPSNTPKIIQKLIPNLRKPRYTLYQKLVVSEHFIPNVKHKKYCIPEIKHPNIQYTPKRWPTLSTQTIVIIKSGYQPFLRQCFRVKTIKRGKVKYWSPFSLGFNLIQPSLIEQLKKILDQYPDDGQILKVRQRTT